jgi:glycosyltransferase involved in cell wall biosynthesis
VVSYAVVTAARNEAENLPRLAEALRDQTHRPAQWLIVDNGSTDGTSDVARRIGAETPWAVLLSRAGSALPIRGAPIVQAINDAIEALDPVPDVLVNVDADISMDADYFERLLAAFEADPSLGIASGSAYELDDGEWRQRHVTGFTVWGATRAYRWSCLQEVLPLEERLGWDGIDEAKARARGWRTRTLVDLGFRHHRREGERDASRFHRWAEVGRSAHYMGYRIPYLVARALHQSRRDPAALAMMWGYASAVLRRAPRLDAEARRVVRSDQRLRDLAKRRREALGRARSAATPADGGQQEIQ